MPGQLHSKKANWLLITIKVDDRFDGQQVLAICLFAASAGLSLYFGYVANLNMLSMLQNQTFDPYNQVYKLYAHAQFYSLLISTFFLAHFAVHDLNRNRAE